MELSWMGSSPWIIEVGTLSAMLFNIMHAVISGFLARGFTSNHFIVVHGQQLFFSSTLLSWPRSKCVKSCGTFFRRDSSLSACLVRTDLGCAVQREVLLSSSWQLTYRSTLAYGIACVCQGICCRGKGVVAYRAGIPSLLIPCIISIIRIFKASVWSTN